MSEQASMDAFLQLMEATEEMQDAMLAAAKLLKDCTCQRQRAESLAAVTPCRSSPEQMAGSQTRHDEYLPRRHATRNRPEAPMSKERAR